MVPISAQNPMLPWKEEPTYTTSDQQKTELAGNDISEAIRRLSESKQVDVVQDSPPITKQMPPMDCNSPTPFIRGISTNQNQCTDGNNQLFTQKSDLSILGCNIATVVTPLKSQSLTTRSRTPQPVSRSGGSSPCLTTSPMEEMIRCIDRSSKLDRDVAYKNDGTADKTTRNLTITTSIITEGRGVQSYVVSPCDHENLFNIKNGFECLTYTNRE